MDHKRNFQETFLDEIPREFHFIIHSDSGARHADKCAAAAWVVEMTYRDESSGHWFVQPFAFSATYINSAISSFTAEALALCQATVFINTLIHRLYHSRVVGKRQF